MTVKGRNEGRLRNENIFAAFARQPLLLHKTIKSYNPLVMAFPKHHPPSLCNQYSQTEILRISFVFGQKNQNQNFTFLCVFRIGFPFAKLLRNFCERKRKFCFLCATFLRDNIVLWTIIRKLHFAQNALFRVILFCPILWNKLSVKV